MDICIDMCIGVCIGECIDMCIGMCIDMCIDVYTDMCIDTADAVVRGNRHGGCQCQIDLPICHTCVRAPMHARKCTPARRPMADGEDRAVANSLQHISYYILVIITNM